jgi:hypothetical protein
LILEFVFCILVKILSKEPTEVKERNMQLQRPPLAGKTERALERVSSLKGNLWTSLCLSLSFEQAAQYCAQLALSHISNFSHVALLCRILNFPLAKQNN